MLKVVIPKVEVYDELTGEFRTICEETTLYLEHSLLSVVKWESKWNKPFLSGVQSLEESIDYIKCMTVRPNSDTIPDSVYNNITQGIMDQINSYIDKPMTATWFSNTDTNEKSTSSVVTNEIIYYWMITYGIPFECEKWHLNRLMTLIRVCIEKNRPEKKISRNEILDRNRRLNAERRAKMKTNG